MLLSLHKFRTTDILDIDRKLTRGNVRYITYIELSILDLLY